MRPRVLPLPFATSLVLLVIAAGLSVLGASSASAETVVVRDPVRDVWFFAARDGDDWDRVPDRTTDDVRSMRIDHTARGLVLTTTMRRLPQTDDSPGGGPKHTIDRARGTTLQVFTNVSGDGPDLDVFTGRGDDFRRVCRGDASLLDVDRRAERVTVTLTRRCLGDQPWVRVTSTSSSPIGRNYFVDEVGNRGHEEGEKSERVSRAG